MKRVILSALAVLLTAELCGCALLLVGAGVAGGIAVSNDTAKIEKDATVGHAWARTQKVLKDMGSIKSENKEGGRIEASVQGSDVTATVTQMTKKSVRVEVKARKGLFPNLDLAMEIANKIGSEL